MGLYKDSPFNPFVEELSSLIPARKIEEGAGKGNRHQEIQFPLVFSRAIAPICAGTLCPPFAYCTAGTTVTLYPR
jgi:hypothetical protein